MTIRITGMNSGLDTESIIRELTKVEKDKVTKVKNEQKRLEMKQDKWKDLNKKVVNFYNKSLSNLRFDGSYVKKNTSVSNDKVAGVTTNGNAMNGTQNLEVKTLAESAYMTGGKVKTKSSTVSTGPIKYTDANGIEKTATGDTKLSDMGFKVGDEISVNVGGQTYSTTVRAENWTLGNLNTRLNAVLPSGVQVSYDDKTGLSINDGSASFGVSAQSVFNDGREIAKTSTGLALEDGEKYTSANIALDENNASFDFETAAVGDTYTDKYGVIWTKLDETDEGSGGALWQAGIPDDVYTSAKQAEEWDSKSNALSSMFTVKEGATETAKNDTKMSELGISGTQNLRLNFGGGDKEFFDIEVKETDTINDVLSKLKSAASESGYKINANYDEKQGRFYLSSSETGAEKGFSIDATHSSYQLLDALGLNENSADESKRAKFNAGKDAEIELNGVTYTSDSNQFDINGLSITAKDIGTAKITTSDDASGVYDMIKGFISEYNELIKEITTLYNGEKNKDFDFLTADQKEEMTDDEIADWNKKIDESIMSRDDTLGKIMRNMKNIMLSTFDLTDKNGKNLTVSLSTFGIGTLSYSQAEKNERAMYHIDGDEDDEYTSGNDDKLKSLINSDPGLVSEFFKNLSKSLYSKLGDMMKSTDFSSSFTLYDDKLMKKNYDEYKTKIKKAEDQLALREDSYYKQYAKLEKAMGEINSQQSALGGMMG